MKQNSKSKARTKADSEQKDEDMFVCQHREKTTMLAVVFILAPLISHRTFSLIY
jgi:hypothetical protein